MIAYNLAAWYANDASDHELLNGAHNVAARLTEDENGIVAELPENVQDVLRHNDRDKFFYQVLSLKNVRLAGDAVLPLPRMSTPDELPKFRNATVNGMEVRMARIQAQLPNDEKVVIVQVARTLNARRELINKIFLSIVIPQLILGALSIVAVWLGVKRGLKPLVDLSDAIQKRSQLDLTLIDERVPAEMTPIVTALNSLFVRIRAHIEAQDRFVANAAHQLRTPVAALQTYIEYGRRVKQNQFTTVLDQLDTAANRISDLIAGLLVLARAGSRHNQQFEKVDLNMVTSQVISELLTESRKKRIDLNLLSNGEAVVYGYSLDLHEMITNLIENAIRYTPEDGNIEVSIKSGPPIIFSVKDSGPGIPTSERQKVFERFYRVLGTKVSGSGLGLAIVNEVAQSHNAKVELTEATSGRGTIARVTFTG